MALLTLQSIDKTGVAITFGAAASGGDLVPNNGGDSILAVTNGGGSPITVTATASKSCSHGFTHNLSITVNAGATKHIKLPSYLNNEKNQVAISYSAVTSVTVAAYK